MNSVEKTLIGRISPITVGYGTWIAPHVVTTKNDRIKIDDHSRIDDFVKLEGGERLQIGCYVHVASFVHLNIGGGTLIIEDGAAFASGCRVVTGGNDIQGQSRSAVAPPSQQQRYQKTTLIKRNAFICAGATLLPGVTIGERAVVAAGAVVHKDVPDYEIWAGVPTKKIGEVQR